MRHLSPFRINTSKFPRSDDYGGLMRNLSPFIINTSKKRGGRGVGARVCVGTGDLCQGTASAVP